MGGRGKKSSGTKAAETAGFSYRRLAEARFVLNHAPDLRRKRAGRGRGGRPVHIPAHTPARPPPSTAAPQWEPRKPLGGATKPRRGRLNAPFRPAPGPRGSVT